MKGARKRKMLPNMVEMRAHAFVRLTLNTVVPRRKLTPNRFRQRCIHTLLMTGKAFSAKP